MGRSLLERGCCAVWPEGEVEATLDDLYRLMAHLCMIDHAIMRVGQTEIRHAVYEQVPRQGFWYPQVAEGAPVRTGQCLGYLTDAAGRLLQEYRAAFDGVVLYYTVTLGVQAGDPLIAYGAG